MNCNQNILNSIKKLIYVIYPSGLGGEFLSYIISNSIVNCNKNSANINPELNNAWQGSCLFQFFSDIRINDTPVNQEYIKKHSHNFSKWFVCKDHPGDKLYKFLLKNFSNAKIIILIPELNDEYYAKMCIYKTNKLLDATEENLNKFLLHNYNEFFSEIPTTRNWNHETSKTLIDYRPYMKKFRERFFSSKKWWRPELWLLASSILNNGTYLNHNSDVNELVSNRTKEYENDIKNLKPYINNFDTLVIPGSCYKQTPTEFFKHLSSKFNINVSKNVVHEFQKWIDINNKIAYG